MKMGRDDVSDDVVGEVLPALARPRHSAEKRDDAFPEGAGPTCVVGGGPVPMHVIVDKVSQMQVPKVLWHVEFVPHEKVCRSSLVVGAPPMAV